MNATIELDEKYFRFYRRCLTYLENFDVDFSSANISDVEFFDYAIEYELAYCGVWIYRLVKEHTYSTNVLPLLRRWLELVAILNLMKGKEATESNFKLFRAIALKRKLTDRNVKRIREELKIPKKIDLNKVIKRYGLFFLFGTINDEITYDNIVKCLNEKIKISNNCMDFSFLYRFLSIEIHYSYDIDFVHNDLVERVIKDSLPSVDKSLKSVFKKAIKLNAYENPTPFDNEEELNNFIDFAAYAKGFRDFLSYSGLTFYSLIFRIIEERVVDMKAACNEDDFTDVVIAGKSFFEKLATSNEIIKLPYEKASKKEGLYFDTCRVVVLNLFDDKETLSYLESEAKRIYEEDEAKKEGLNYYDYLSIIKAKPGFVINRKATSISENIKTFIGDVTSDPVKADSYFRLYSLLNRLSHSDAFLAFKNKERFKEIAYDLFLFVKDTLSYFYKEFDLMLESKELSKSRIKVLGEFEHYSVKLDWLVDSLEHKFNEDKDLANEEKINEDIELEDSLEDESINPLDEDPLPLLINPDFLKNVGL